MNTVSTKTTKVLSEKLALAHEVTNLKAELEHLRAEASLYQAALSEKLALQRELNTLAVELEDQKKATQRALVRQQEDTSQDMKFEAQVVKLRKELVREKHDHERAEREAQKALEAEEEKRTAVESKLERTKEKLRAIKAAFRETEAELQQVKVSEAAAKIELERPKKKARKRKAPEINLEETAPSKDKGVMNRALAKKRDKRVSSMPGEKSTFSITPFLNRTASLAPDSPPPPQPQLTRAEATTETCPPSLHQDEESGTRAEAPSHTNQDKKKAQNPSRATNITQDEDGAVKEKIAKSKSKASAPKKRAAAPPLSQVIEENEEVEATVEVKQVRKPAATEKEVKMTAQVSAVTVEPEKKGKKRKLLGSGASKTLFDEDEGGKAVRPLGTSLFGGGNALPVLSRTLAGKKVGSSIEFSPLKRDRRAGSSISGLG